MVEKYLFLIHKHYLGEIKVKLWTVDITADKRIKMLGIYLYGNVEAK